MSWQETIDKHFVFSRSDTSLAFYPPVPAPDLTLAEQKLGVRFPHALKALLAETNGVGLHLRLNNPPDDLLIGYLIWPLERIIADNITFRINSQITSTYMPFDNLLFFSDPGNGDLYGFSILSHPTGVDRIYCWDHENDSRVCVANSLTEFFRFMSK